MFLICTLCTLIKLYWIRFCIVWIFLITKYDKPNQTLHKMVLVPFIRYEDKKNSIQFEIKFGLALHTLNSTTLQACGDVGSFSIYIHIDFQKYSVCFMEMYVVYHLLLYVENCGN